MDSGSRDHILKTLSEIEHPDTNESFVVDRTINHFRTEDPDPVIAFAEQFISNGGKFIFCNSFDDIQSQFQQILKVNNIDYFHCFDDPLKDIFKDSNNNPKFLLESEDQKVTLCLTKCVALISRTGSIVVSSDMQTGRTSSLLPDIHVVIASQNQIVPSMKEYLEIEKSDREKLPSMISFISSNSKTADIEKTLVNGAHGPKELYLLLV